MKLNIEYSYIGKKKCLKSIISDRCRIYCPCMECGGSCEHNEELRHG